MLTVQFIRDHKEKVLNSLKVRNFDQPEILDEVLKLDDLRKNTQQELDKIRSEAKSISGKIGQLYKSGKAEEANALKAETAKLKTQTKELEESERTTKEALRELLLQIPNATHQSVPSGNGDEDNEIFKAWGQALPEMEAEALPHWVLAAKYDIIDFEAGAKITGAGFPLYKAKGAKLQRALINFFLDEAEKAGYAEFIPPHLVNEASAMGTGQLPDKEGQMYHVTEDNLYLIPTAEVPLTNIYRDVILEEQDFPICLTGYTPCFRREAGSYGAHVRGLNRLHQFDKVEIVRIELGLPYRILRLCGGDIGFTSALTFDFETYSAAQKRWLEVSSVSNFESFQANRLRLRYRPAEGKGTELAHTLNGSALALPRIVATLLENNQTPEGILIPEALQAYTGFDRID